MTRYFGAVCTKHPANGGERRTATKCCVECTREIKRKSRKANPESNRISARKSNSKFATNNRGARNAILAKYRASKLRATPGWVNHFIVGEAYDLAKLREKVCGGRWHVDHIVPLQSDIVCGLHVEHNLRVIPGSENESKCNRYWPGMP